MSASRYEPVDGHVLSGWWRRAAASLLDTAIITIPASATLWAFGFDFGEYYGEEGSLLVSSRMIDVTYLLVDAAFATLYFMPLMVAWNGQTLGKRALGIRVIRADREPLDAMTVFARQILIQYLMVGFLIALSVINYLLPLKDRENRAGHDLLVKTRVIRG